MNPRLKSTSANPAAARDLGPQSRRRSTTTSSSLALRTRVEAREVAVEMLELFMTDDRDFRRWQKLGQLLGVAREPDRQEASDEWAWSSVRNY